MQKNILWTGIENRSLENLIITFTDTGTETTSCIIGFDNNAVYKAEYKISTDHLWQTISLEIKTQCNDLIQTIKFQSDGKGNWRTNEQPSTIFEGCIDIDISLSPFTNTLPINRLNLSEGQSETIKVLYIDILNHKLNMVRQVYTKLTKTKYKYQNVPNDFESIITVDEDGLVVSYPQLFKRVMIKESNYKIK
jgi:hypothetical protein